MEIWNDYVNFRVLGSPYNRRFYCSVTHTLKILPFMMGVSSLREMEFRSLIISTRSLSEDSGSTSLDSCLWELFFSLVSPLWDSCYSLA